MEFLQFLKKTGNIFLPKFANHFFLGKRAIYSTEKAEKKKTKIKKIFFFYYFSFVNK